MTHKNLVKEGLYIPNTYSEHRHLLNIPHDFLLFPAGLYILTNVMDIAAKLNIFPSLGFTDRPLQTDC